MEVDINDQKEYNEAFLIFDTDKDGKLNEEEVAYAFMALGIVYNEEEINKIMEQYGQNGLINFNSFSDYLSKRSKDSELEDDLIECFKEMDKDQDGKVNKKDLKYLLYSLGEKFNDNEIDEIIQQIDTNGEGYFTYQDMVKIILDK